VATLIVHLADAICNGAGLRLHHGTGYVPATFPGRAWSELGIDPAELPEIQEEIRTELLRAEAILGASSQAR
jgi:hypothetical protein